MEDGVVEKDEDEAVIVEETMVEGEVTGEEMDEDSVLDLGPVVAAVLVGEEPAVVLCDCVFVEKGDDEDTCGVEDGEVE